MSIALTQTATAVRPLITASFLGIGGTGTYTYSILPNGAGGSINSSTGIYTAPAVSDSQDLEKLYDTIRVVDSLGASALSQILIGTPLLLVCEILQRELGLARDHIYLWDQKIFQPKDSGLYLAIGILNTKPFANTFKFNSDGTSTQSVNMLDTLSIDIISRGPEARDRRADVLLALKSAYAEKQQEANSFQVGVLSTTFTNLSQIDGSAIPYRFNLSAYLQYSYVKVSAVDYFDTFAKPTITTEP